MIEVRGTAIAGLTDGKAFGDRFEDTIVRIQPTRMVSHSIDSGDLTANARSVTAT